MINWIVEYHRRKDARRTIIPFNREIKYRSALKVRCGGDSSIMENFSKVVFLTLLIMSASECVNGMYIMRAT